MKFHNFKCFKEETGDELLNSCNKTSKDKADRSRTAVFWISVNSNSFASKVHNPALNAAETVVQAIKIRIKQRRVEGR